MQIKSRLLTYLFTARKKKERDLRLAKQNTSAMTSKGKQQQQKKAVKKSSAIRLVFTDAFAGRGHLRRRRALAKEENVFARCLSTS